MAATHRYPIIPPSVLARAYQQHQNGLTWLDAANANRIGYTAMMSQLRKAGYDMTLRHPNGRAGQNRKREREVQSADFNSTAVRMLQHPLRAS